MKIYVLYFEIMFKIIINPKDNFRPNSFKSELRKVTHQLNYFFSDTKTTKANR